MDAQSYSIRVINTHTNLSWSINQGKSILGHSKTSLRPVKMLTFKLSICFRKAS